MQAAIPHAPESKAQRWASLLLSGLPALFLLADATGKFVQPAPVVEATVQLGYPASVILPLGVVLLVCTIIYLIPRTNVLGAILLTGYLGGAVATHVRVGGGLFPMLLPVVLGAMLWGGIYLRDEAWRALLPLTTPAPVETNKKRLWAGRILTALPALMLLFSGVMKLMKPAPVLQEFARLGYQENVIVSIGMLELFCVAIFLIPRTAVLGAILLTGYLGGAVATHVRVSDPFIPPLVIGVLLWAGLYCRAARLRALLPWRK